MQRKFLLPLFLSFVLSFFINFLTNKDLLVSSINSITLVSSIYLFKEFLKTTFLNSIIISLLGLIPLFSYLPNTKFYTFLPLISLGFFILYNRMPKKWVLIIWAIFLFIANLYIGEVIRFPLHVQHTQLIFNSPEIHYNLRRHQEDALFIPFKTRQILYSNLIYIYASLTNFFDAINLKNLSDVFLIANLYPLFAGFYKIFKQENKFRGYLFVTFLLTIITAGIDRSPDKFQSLYLLGPIFIYLILTSLQNINKKIYFSFLVLSLFILINPKI